MWYVRLFGLTLLSLCSGLRQNSYHYLSEKNAFFTRPIRAAIHRSELVTTGTGIRSELEKGQGLIDVSNSASTAASEIAFKQIYDSILEVLQVTESMQSKSESEQIEMIAEPTNETPQSEEVQAITYEGKSEPPEGEPEPGHTSESEAESEAITEDGQKAVIENKIKLGHTPEAEQGPTFEGEAEHDTEELAGEIKSEEEPVSEGTFVRESTLKGTSIPKSTPEGKSIPESSPEGKSVPESTPEGKSVPESTLEGKSVPESTPEGKSVPESTPEVKLAQESIPVVEYVPESTSEGASVPESTPEGKSVPESTHDGKYVPESTPEVKSVPESIPEIESILRSIPAGELVPDSTLEGESVPKSILDAEFIQESTPEVEPVPESIPEGEPLPESFLGGELVPEFISEGKAVPESIPGNEPIPESTPEGKSLPEFSPEGKSLPKSTPEGKSKLEFTAESKSVPESPPDGKSVPESTPEIELVPESIPEGEYVPESTSEGASVPESDLEGESVPESSLEGESVPESSLEHVEGESVPKSTPEGESLLGSIHDGESVPKSIHEGESIPESIPEGESLSESTPEGESLSESFLKGDSVPKSISEGKAVPESISEVESIPESFHDGESVPESTLEGESEPESIPEGESVQEPTPEEGLVPEFEPEGHFAEPIPDWDVAMTQYKWGWDFLVYLFGIMFLLLGSYNVFNIARLLPMQHLFSRNYFVVLNILIAIIAFLRGLYLLIDAQNKNKTFPIILNYFLYSTAFPCLTSAFCILFYALLLATKVQVLSTKIQKLSVLIGIITFHFGLSVVTDVVVGLFARAQVLMLICQLFYIIWGTILFAGFLYIFTKLRKAAISRSKISIHRGHTDRYTYQTRRIAIRKHVISVSSDYTSRKIKRGKKKTYNLNTSVKITLIAAILGLVCILLEIYGIFCVYKIQIDKHSPEPWPYFSYQFLLRLVEFCMCFLMVYVTTQSVHFQRSSWHDIVERAYDTFGHSCCTHQQNETKSFEFISPALDVNHNIDENHEQVMSKFHDHDKKKKQNLHARFKEFGKSRSSLTTNLPDLVHSAVIQEKRNASIDLSNTCHAEIHEESHNNSIFIIEMEFNVKEIETINCDVQMNKTCTGDMSSVDRISFITSETLGSNLNLSAVSLMESMEIEFKQAFERSFGQTSLHKSASDNSCTIGLQGSGFQLLNSESAI